MGEPSFYDEKSGESRLRLLRKFLSCRNESGTHGIGINFIKFIQIPKKEVGEQKTLGQEDMYIAYSTNFPGDFGKAFVQPIHAKRTAILCLSCVETAEVPFGQYARASDIC